MERPSARSSENTTAGWRHACHRLQVDQRGQPCGEVVHRRRKFGVDQSILDPSFCAINRERNQYAHAGKVQEPGAAGDHGHGLLSLGPRQSPASVAKFLEAS